MASPSASAVAASSNDGPSEVDPTSTSSASQNGSSADQPSAAPTLPITQPPSNPSIASVVSPSPSSDTVSAAQNVALSATAVTNNAITSTASSNPASIPAPSLAPAAASLLPRSTMTGSTNVAASSASSSSSNSGTATPTNRPQPITQHYTPARASSSLGLSSSLAAGRGRRVSQHNPSSRTRFTSAASAMASTDNTNVVPSIFGYYSHDANPTTQASPNTVSTSSNAVPGWRMRSSNPQPAPPRSSGPVRIDRSFLASPNASPRVGSLSFYQHGTRQPWDSPSTLGTTYPSRTLPDHTAAAATTAHSVSFNSNNGNSNDTGLFASALPAPQPTFEETTTISFTWTIRDLHLLREEVEQTPPPSEGGRSVSAGAGKSDVWTNQPVFGDNKWKLELVRTTRPLTDQEQDISPNRNDSIEDEPVSPSAPSGAVETDNAEASRQRNSITILSVYLTALVLDYTHANVEIPASIMIGLRPLRAAVGRRGAEDGGYLWRRFYDYVFQKEADLFTCHDLPSVSEMLQDIGVARDDAIVLTIQLGLGPGHTRRHAGSIEDSAVARAPVEVDGHQLVPRAVINSLSGLLDDANTGDVRILVRERGILLPSESAAMSDDDVDSNPPAPRIADTCSRVVPHPIGASCPPASAEAADVDALDSIEDDPDRIFVRDRVLWAHASVLRSRSDYFHTMLGSDFSEGIGRSLGAEVGSASRHVRTLRIPDADFVTAYWFLRYLYTDDIQFADQEDVRSAVLDEEWAKGADLGCPSSSADTGIGGGEGVPSRMLVDWTPVSQLKDYDDFDMDADAGADPAGMGYSMSRGHPSSSSVERRDVSGSFVLQASPLRNTAPASSATTSGSLRPRTSAGGLGNSSSSGAGTGTGSSAGPEGGNTASAPTSPLIPAASSIGSGAGKHHYTADEAYHVGGRQRNASMSAAAGGGRDPHPHPCSHPGPASALAIFRLAHRYHMQELSRLASVHLVATLTPQTAFAMLLATAVYAELHARIKTYVYQHWHLVSRTPEFERCCDEVSVGMWGADAGKTLRAFVRSLVSPLHAGASVGGGARG